MQNMDEQWFPVPGYPEYATIGGEIYRVAENGSPAGKVTGKPRRPSVSSSGYRIITLFRDKQKKSFKMSNLICEAAHGPKPDPRYHCCHNDGDRTNDLPSNLRWASPSENNADKIAHGTWQGGSSNGRAVLSEADVLAIRADQRKYNEIAAQYGVARVTISAIKRRLLWRHL